MAVNLSPVGGVAAQFFTNTGAVLTGGKIYTYAAGTTTPATTYTTGAGTIPWTNPIVLDAAGRVSGSGEIWLTDGINYKFVLKDSTDVLIATYDNITGINSNFVNFVAEQEIQTATAGQTVFTLTTTEYQPGTNTLSVFVDGVNQYGPGAQYAYTETSSTVVTFVSGLHVGASVKFTTTQTLSGGAIDSSQVTYDPPFVDSVPTNVELKLAQYVSVKDFGATGNGTTDDTTAIQNALDASDSVFFPEGEYIISATLNVPKGVSIYGAGYESVILNGYALADPDSILYLTGGDQFSTIDNLTFKGKASGSESIGIEVNNGYYASYTNLRFTNLSYGLLLDEAGSCLIQNCHFTNCLFGAQCMGGSAYKFDSCEFQYGTDVGIKLTASPTSTYPTSAIVVGSGFTSNVGIDVPRVPGAYGGNSISVDNCYFEGDLNYSTLTKAFRVGETGSGNSVVMASISNCRVAGSNSVKSIFANTTRLYFANNIVGAAMEVQNTVLGAEYIGNDFTGTFTNNTLATLTLDLGTIQTNWIDNATYAQLRLAQGGHGVDVLTTRVRPVVTNEISLGDNAYLFTNAYLTGGLYINTVRWTTGAGSPEGSLSAPVGSMYTRTDGGANTTLYVKESGTGNTGWVAK